MKSKTIDKVLTNKFDEWVKTIDDTLEVTRIANLHDFSCEIKSLFTNLESKET